jgi:hypothetical protein
VIVTTAPMGNGVRVAGPRVPASTLTFRTAGGGVRESSLRTSSARFPGNTSTTGSNRRWRPVCSRRTVRQQPGNSGPSTPVRPAATRYAPQHPLKRTGALLGSQSGAKGDGRARTKDIPARIRGAGGHPACREYAKKGQWSQVTCAPVVVAYRVGHAFFGPMTLRRRATWDAALPGAGAAGFTLPRVIGR